MMFLNINVQINIALAVFNMIPIPPLDGSRIVTWILPNGLKEIYNKINDFIKPKQSFHSNRNDLWA